MPGLLNALARARRLFAPRSAPGARLDPARFLAHAAALAAAEPAPQGLWITLIAATGFVAPAGAEVIVGDGAEALSRARAPFVAWLPAQGKLAPQAVARIAEALAHNADAHALYTDEIVTVADLPSEVLLKPAFDPVLLDAFDYFGRVAVYRRDLAVAMGSAGDYERALRIAAQAPPGAILHLPYPAWVGPAPNSDPEATQETIRRVRALSFAPGLAPDRLRPLLVPEPRVWPRVNIVIPSRDAPDLIGATLEGLFGRTDYPDFDVTVVDNGSTDPATLGLYRRFASPRFRADIEPAPFNFSRAVNRGAALSEGPLILLLNNDVEVLESGWLKEMVGCMDYPGTGIVGAKLLFPDGTLQHAGVIAGLGGYAGHWHIGRPENEPGPQRRLYARQSMSVVTGACMLVSRAAFAELGGFDEATFPVAYNDVDFCLRAGKLGIDVIWTPFAKLVHKESASRGSDETAANRERFARDKAALQTRHRTDVFQDRAYNPWAVRGHSDPWPQALASLPPARS